MRHKLIVGLLAVAVLAAGAQTPQRVFFHIVTGEYLVNLCKVAELDSRDPCLNYIAGFTDGYATGMIVFNNSQQARFCPSREVTPFEMAKVLVKYGNDHPEDLSTRAALFTAYALKDAYPCQEP